MTKNTNLKKYGLLGKNINYSFSKKYFTDKFNEEKRFDCKYENYDINSIEEFKRIISDHPIPNGLNVTIPYKKSIIKFLDELTEEAAEIPTVASSLEMALEALDNDRDFLKEGGVMTDDMIDAYIDLKSEEVTTLNMSTHPVEFDMYYSV